MPTPGSTKKALDSATGRFQTDWIATNLRWLLLVGVAVVSLADTHINRGGILDPNFLLPQLLLLAIIAFYNVGITMVLSRRAFTQGMAVVTLLIDTILTIGFILASGDLTSPLLFFALFPVFTTALHFHWVISLFVTLVIAVVCGLAGYVLATPTTNLAVLILFVARVAVLLLASLVIGMVGNRAKKTSARRRRLEEETELRRRRAAQEHSRAIFELASTLSATLNYNKVLEAVLEVGEAGMRELGQPSSTHASAVMLFGQNHLHIVTSRHLPHRDRNAVFEGKSGIIAEALASAEALVTDDPAADPELRQLIAMHSCRQAIAVPLRAGFESYGAVIFGSTQPNTYTENQKALLTAVCNQAIVALQNAQLYQSLQEEKERIVKVEEDERKKLARNLHDGPTQSIAAIAMRLNYVQMLLDKEQDVKQTIEELAKVEELARRTTKEIRHMLFTLRPLILETQGLKAALEQYASKLAETYSTPVRLEIPAEVDQLLDRHAQGVVWYIIEEAVSNARKHAEADNIWVRLYVRDNTLIAEVEDDGTGFDVEAVQGRYDERGSLGLVNMYERAALINGSFSMASAPGKGTRNTLVVPLSRR